MPWWLLEARRSHDAATIWKPADDNSIIRRIGGNILEGHEAVRWVVVVDVGRRGKVEGMET